MAGLFQITIASEHEQTKIHAYVRRALLVAYARSPAPMYAACLDFSLHT